MKKITIITVALNSESTIKKTLDSVFKQSHAEIEHIVIDGGSSDNTRLIVQSHPSNLIAFHELKGSTIYEAMNYGIQLAKNEYIAFLNSDDYYLDDDSISNIMKLFEGDDRLDAVFGDVEFFNEGNESRVIRRYQCKDFTPNDLCDGIMPAHPGMVLRTAYYRSLNGFSKAYKIAADFDFIFRLFRKHKIKYINTQRVLVRMRAGGISTSGIRSKLQITKEIYKSIRENGAKINLRILYKRFFKKLLQIKL
ncbi:glycosyltransferase [Polynucleobacter sp. MWH-UH23A]|uniref:glycosyltransferase n=1 Tax=Polynucleobacter sp. MWH-UH23A TaxID=1855613 RepID=UPI003364C2C5